MLLFYNIARHRQVYWFKNYMKKSVKSLSLQFLKFGLVGIFNTIISTVTTYGLLIIFNKLNFFFKSLDVQVIISSFLGFSVSFINSYYWNSRLVFKMSSNKFFSKSFIKSYFCYFLTWIISYVITAFLATVLYLPKFWIPLFTLLFTVPLNFLANKFWAFR